MNDLQCEHCFTSGRINFLDNRTDFLKMNVFKTMSNTKKEQFPNLNHFNNAKQFSSCEFHIKLDEWLTSRTSCSLFNCSWNCKNKSFDGRAIVSFVPFLFFTSTEWRSTYVCLMFVFCVQQMSNTSKPCCHFLNNIHNLHSVVVQVLDEIVMFKFKNCSRA